MSYETVAVEGFVIRTVLSAREKHEKKASPEFMKGWVACEAAVMEGFKKNPNHAKGITVRL